MILRLLLLALPFGIVLLGFDARFARLNPSHFAVKKGYLESQAEKVEVLILGSSHELTGIVPSALGRPAFNLASQSQSLYYDVGLLEKHLPHLPSLKVVILPVSYFSLEYELKEGAEKWRAFHYSYFYGLPHQDWHESVSARNFSAYFLSSETMRARVLLGRATNALTEYDSWGGWTNRLCPEPVSENHSAELRKAATEILKVHHGMMKPGYIEDNLARLRRAVQECKQRGIQVLLITSPVSRYYAEGVKHGSYEIMQKGLAELGAEQGIPYLNFMQDARFTDADFKDADHLNCQGALKFSDLMRRAIASPVGDGSGLDRTPR